MQEENSYQNIEGVEPQWLDKYQQLKRYFQQYGDCNVPQKYKENPSLGSWVNTQRQHYKKGELLKEKVNLLNQLNFVWDLFEARWCERYQQLKDYYDEHQHSNVPQRYKDNPSLGRWVGTQRIAYKEHKMSQERIDLLNQLNFDWGN